MCGHLGASTLAGQSWSISPPVWALEIVHHAATWPFFACFCGVSLLCIHFLLLSKNSSGLLWVVCALYLPVLLPPFQNSVPPPADPSGAPNPNFFLLNSLLLAFLFSTSVVFIQVWGRKLPNHRAHLVVPSLRDPGTAMSIEFNIWEQLLRVFANEVFMAGG